MIYLALAVFTMMTLCWGRETKIEICADGEDEIIAVETLVALVQSGFGEA
ncbi:MAG: HPr family phosphocarrier protein [Eubacteriaceae bacterium]|nr:HPr family phosphocarrier protein [Eubacteriaceae bacterium]